MHPQLTQMIVQQRTTELQRAGACARLVRDMPARQRTPSRRRIARVTARLAGFTGRFAPTGP
jgi:hypothetical protein